MHMSIVPSIGCNIDGSTSSYFYTNSRKLLKGQQQRYHCNVQILFTPFLAFFQSLFFTTEWYGLW